jgi:hypothetical protein
VSFFTPAKPHIFRLCRFLSTLNAILKSPERGGLLANNLVYRYDASQVDDGVGGEEGGEPDTVSISKLPRSLTLDIISSIFPLHFMGRRGVSGRLNEIYEYLLTSRLPV